MPFVGLITNMIDWYIDASIVEKRKIINTLLQYEGLLRSIVQWGFWGNENRPDIMKELGAEVCTLIAVKIGRKMTTRLVLHEASIENGSLGEEETMGRLESIVSTPIVSKEYDPNCMISYVAGMIRMVKAAGCTRHDFTLIRCCMSNADCVAKAS